MGAEGSSYSEPSRALATVEQMQDRFREQIEGIPASVLSDILVEATAAMESRTGRRLTPFVGHVFDDHLIGIDPTEYYSGTSMPVDIYASLGISKSRALSSDDNCRHFWLPEYAPFYPDLWTYNIQSAVIFRTFGDMQVINVQGGGMEGPSLSDGHCWLRAGTFAPLGSRIRVIYDGGYTVATPPDLRRACLYQAAQFIIVENEPQQRITMDTKELESQIASLLAPWVRG